MHDDSIFSIVKKKDTLKKVDISLSRDAFMNGRWLITRCKSLVSLKNRKARIRFSGLDNDPKYKSNATVCRGKKENILQKIT